MNTFSKLSSGLCKIGTLGWIALAGVASAQQYTGAGSTSTPRQMTYPSQADQQRSYQDAANQRYQQALENARREALDRTRQQFVQERYYKANPLERPTYKFVEKATPWVGRTSDCALGVVGSVIPFGLVSKKGIVGGCITGVAGVPD